MQVRWIGRLGGILALTLALAGCVDVTMDVKVRNAAEAQVTMTQVISAQFYPMIKASKSSEAGASSDDFCKNEDGGTLVENADGSATCTITKSGKFADLGFDDARFVLPKLVENEHLVEVNSLGDGQLFALPAVGLKEQREERRRRILHVVVARVLHETDDLHVQ